MSTALPSAVATLSALILGLMVLLPPATQARELGPLAEEPFKKGMSAAQAQDWAGAVGYFRDAEKADPQASEIWFNLGVASSKLPGYEIRAIALFKAFLLANPDTPKAAAISAQIATLESGLRSKLAKILDGVEPLLLRIKSEVRRDIYEDGIWSIAAGRYYLGDASGAMMLIAASEGNDWRSYFSADLHGSSQDNGEIADHKRAFISAMVSGGDIETAMDLTDFSFNQDTFDFLLEQDDIAHAMKYLNENKTQGWAELACVAFYGNNNKILAAALSGAKSKIESILSSNSCKKILWWSVGRIDYLLHIGTYGVPLGVDLDGNPDYSLSDISLSKIAESTGNDNSNYGSVIFDIMVDVSSVRTLGKEYRKIHGPGSVGNPK